MIFNNRKDTMKNILLTIGVIASCLSTTVTGMHQQRPGEPPRQILNPARFPHLRGPDAAGQYLSVRSQPAPTTPAPQTTIPAVPKAPHNECAQQ
jgi:hypothetical protein